MRHAFVLVLLAVAGCAPAPKYYETPVTPSPASADESKAIAAFLNAEWRNWSTIHTDGREVEETTFRVYMVFKADGTGAQGLGRDRKPFTYTLEGRNLKTTDPGYPCLRIDKISKDELRMFWYALSVTLVYKPESAFTGLRP